MNIRRFRLIPPAGAPLPGNAVLSALRPSTDGRGLAELLRDQLGVRYVFPVSSGRAALTIILKALKQFSGKREVVIPAYTCFSVPSAVVRAGLSIRLCDVDPKTLDLDQNALARIDLSNVLCIIPSGLYGIPAELVALEKITRASGAYLIDDAAQCLGASLGGKPCGTLGDVGFYSLGRGKNITSISGGIVVTQREDLANLISEEVSKLPPPSVREVSSAVVASIVYAAMLPPSRYWFLDRIPFLGLGLSRFNPNFTMTQLTAYQTRLASQLLPAVDSYNQIRRQNAAKLRAQIEHIEGIEIPRPANEANSVYLRFPILARDRKDRSRLLRRFNGAGIGASTSYPTSISEIPGISRYLIDDQEPCPAAILIATRLIALPTHPFVTSADLDQMAAIIREGHGHSHTTNH